MLELYVVGLKTCFHDCDLGGELKVVVDVVLVEYVLL